MRSLATALLTLTLMAGIAWSIGVRELLPSNDGPQHLFASYVNMHYQEHGWDETVLLNSPITAHGYLELFAIASSFIDDYIVAHQVVLITTCWLWFLAWSALAWTIHKQQPWVLMAFAAATSLQWVIWLGFVPFMLATSVTPILVILRRSPRLLINAVAVALLLVIQAQMHTFAAMLAGLVLLFDTLAREKSWRGFATISAIGIPSALYALWVRHESPMSKGQIIWELHKDIAEAISATVLPGSRAWAIVLAALLVLLVISSVWTFRRGQRGLLIGGLFLFLVSFAVPFEYDGWELVGPRLQPTGAMLMLVGLPIERLRPQFRLGLLALAFAVVGWRFFDVHAINQELREGQRPVQVALSKAPKQDRREWVAVVARPPTDFNLSRVAEIAPFLHIGQAVAPTLGGHPFFSQSIDRTIHTILRPRLPGSVPWLGIVPPLSNVAERLNPDAEPRTLLHFPGVLAAYTWFDALLIYGDKSDMEVAERIGYRVVPFAWDSEGTPVAFQADSFQGCTYEIEFNGAPEDRVIIIGFGAHRAPRDVHFVPATERTLRLDDYPCEAVWAVFDAPCDNLGSEREFLQAERVTNCVANINEADGDDEASMSADPMQGFDDEEEARR